MPAKKKAASAKISKTDFIRNLGPDLPADEIIEKAKAQGLSLTRKYVWTKQSEMRNGKGAAKEGGASRPTKAAGKKTARKAVVAAKRGRKKAAKARRVPIAAVAAKRATQPAERDAVQQMRALILGLGTVRADEVYRQVRADIDAFVGQA
jgi:hypothetical protein